MAIKFFAFFFSDNQYFRKFLVSMADIIGSYERLPNDAVRAVAGNLSGFNIGIITENKVCHPHFVLCTSRLK